MLLSHSGMGGSDSCKWLVEKFFKPYSLQVTAPQWVVQFYPCDQSQLNKWPWSHEWSYPRPHAQDLLCSSPYWFQLDYSQSKWKSMGMRMAEQGPKVSKVLEWCEYPGKWISRKQALADEVAAVSGRKWAMWEHYNPQAALQMIFQN